MRAGESGKEKRPVRRGLAGGWWWCEEPMLAEWSARCAQWPWVSGAGAGVREAGDQ